MHGGRSTGPRTPDGLARLRAARTIHGGYGAETRGFNRQVLSTLRRSRVLGDAIRYEAALPADLAARLHGAAPELALPHYRPGGLSRAEDQAILRAEADALAPWKHAIALARAAERGRPLGTNARALGKAHAPVRGPDPASAPASTTNTGVSGARAEAHAPGDAPSVEAASRADAEDQEKPHAPVRPARGAAVPAITANRGPADAEAGAHAPGDAASVGAASPADVAALAGAHAPEHPTDSATAQADPPTAGDASARAARAKAGPHAPGQRGAAAVPAALARPVEARAEAKPHTPERNCASGPWDGIRRCGPTPAPGWPSPAITPAGAAGAERQPPMGLRQALRGHTQWSTFALGIERVGGWIRVARGAALLEADGVLGRRGAAALKGWVPPR